MLKGQSSYSAVLQTLQSVQCLLFSTGTNSEVVGSAHSSDAICVAGRPASLAVTAITAILGIESDHLQSALSALLPH